MDAEKRKTLVALVRKVDEAEESLRKANADLDRFVDGNGHPSSFVSSEESTTNGSEPPNKALLDYISTHPIVDYGQAARIAYGEDSKRNRDNVQAKLYYLKKNGWVKKGNRRNEWEVVESS